MAGIKPVIILDEPTAAALAYGTSWLKTAVENNIEHEGLDQYMLICDIGGGARRGSAANFCAAAT